MPPQSCAAPAVARPKTPASAVAATSVSTKVEPFDRRMCPVPRPPCGAACRLHRCPLKCPFDRTIACFQRTCNPGDIIGRRGMAASQGRALGGRPAGPPDRPPAHVLARRGRLPPRRSRRLAAADRQGPLRRADHDAARRHGADRGARAGRRVRRAGAHLRGDGPVGDGRGARAERDAFGAPPGLRAPAAGVPERERACS